jgi:hypothetical protein
MVVRGWPGATAVRTGERSGRWHPFEPGFQLVRPYRPRKRKVEPRDSPQLELPFELGPGEVRRRLTRSQRRSRAFDSFRFSLPRSVASVVEPVRHQQWLLLRLLTTGEPALELARSNLALAFCVGARCRRMQLSDPAVAARVRSIVARKRRDLLDWLGFPASPSAVRTLGRIYPASISVRAMLSLRVALGAPEVAKGLAHVPCVNAGVLAIVSDPRLLGATTPTFLSEVAEIRRERHYPFTADLLSDTLDMHEGIHPGGRSRRFSSVESLQTGHEELAMEWCRRERDRKDAPRFPKPPVPATVDIVPLRTRSELLVEGEQQHNCVATYAKRVQARKTYIYRVLRPERATLSIVQGPGGAWRRGELLAAGNTPVRPETEAAVDSWLETFSI